MRTILLTHERELLKKTGTGKVVKSILRESCDLLIWRRKEPSSLLEKELSPDNTVLVYPGGDDETAIDLTPYDNFIIIDGTWQEANKIYNRSPYLKRFRKMSFSDRYSSTYRLRRNQKHSGLCTIESVIEISRLKKLEDIANMLTNAYDNFQTQNRPGKANNTSSISHPHTS